MVVAVAGPNGLNFSGNLNASGTAGNYSRLLPAANVQEQVAGGVNWLVSINSSANISLNFVDLPAMGGNGGLTSFSDSSGYLSQGVMKIRNSTLRGSQISITLGAYNSNFSINLTNNLIERSQISLNRNYPGVLSASAYNNLFHGGALNLIGSAFPYWYFYDNFFKGASISQSGDPSLTINGNNAYMTNATKLGNAPAGDPVLVLADFQTGPLGSYFYPTTGGNLSRLINAGSRAANLVGLYHFTTQTNQVKEANSTVDIGYHYVAVDGSGYPADSDGNGIPDYLEDVNGNGISDWLEDQFGTAPYSSNTNMPGYFIFIAEPKAKSIVP
jgi:hypothetical protein